VPSSVIRWSGPAAMLGRALGAVLSPILAHLWDTYWFSPILEQLRDTYSYAYTTYGRLYFLGLPPELVGLYALRRLRRGGLGAQERWGFRLTLVGMWLAVLGVFTDYWVPIPPGFLWVIIATPFLMAGFVLLGLGLRKADAAPSWVSLVMISAAVGAVPVMFFVLFHVPSGPLLTFHITWFALGYVLWSGRTCPSEAS
jgi:hypothetical protein